MPEETYSASEVKELIAEALSVKLGREIKSGDIKFNFREGPQTVGIGAGEHTERYKEFTGIAIKK